MPMPGVGEEAPDFELPESSEETIRLSDEARKGPVIVAFYPTDWGMICTMEMKRFMKMVDDIERANARLIAISANTTISHRMWKMHLGITFPLLSDPDGDVIRQYDLMIGETDLLRGRSTRAVLIIDQQMKVRYSWKAPDPSRQPDYDEILSVVKGLSP